MFVHVRDMSVCMHMFKLCVCVFVPVEVYDPSWLTTEAKMYTLKDFMLHQSGIICTYDGNTS